jgi:hypothetical protein
MRSTRHERSRSSGKTTPKPLISKTIKNATLQRFSMKRRFQHGQASPSDRTEAPVTGHQLPSKARQVLI